MLRMLAHCSAEVMQKDPVGLLLKSIRYRCIVTNPLFCVWTDATAPVAVFHCICSGFLAPWVQQQHAFWSQRTL